MEISILILRFFDHQQLIGYLILVVIHHFNIFKDGKQTKKKNLVNDFIERIYLFVRGKPGDTPCPGDFDGDGKTDFVVYRKGIYYINPSSDPSIQWTKQW